MWCWNDEPQFLGRWHESVALVFVFALFFGTEGEGEEEVVATSQAPQPEGRMRVNERLLFLLLLGRMNYHSKSQLSLEIPVITRGFNYPELHLDL